VEQQRVVSDGVFAFAAVDGKFEQPFAGHVSDSIVLRTTHGQRAMATLGRSQTASAALQ
jgi:hypothetical protein